MNKARVASIVNHTIETRVPAEVRRWLKVECPVVVNNLSEWDMPLFKTVAHNDLLGVFGFENWEPVIGINYKTLRTVKETTRVTLHEVAHFALWKMGLPNGERRATRIAKEWIQYSNEPD